jgi:hypothetical protein
MMPLGFTLHVPTFSYGGKFYLLVTITLNCLVLPNNIYSGFVENWTHNQLQGAHNSQPLEKTPPGYKLEPGQNIIPNYLV